MIKRVYELKRGDLFMFMNCEFKVCGIRGGRVYYKLNNSGANSDKNSFGQNSQQRVEIIKTFIFKKTV